MAGEWPSEKNDLYIAFLDDFGHPGDFIGRQDPKFNTSPICGFGGFLIPAHSVREMSHFFFKLKCDVLEKTISKSDVHPSEIERKGSSLFRAGIIKHDEKVRFAPINIINKIVDLGGVLTWEVFDKKKKAEDKNVDLSEIAFTRLLGFMNQQLTLRDSYSIIVMDDNSGRRKNLIRRAARTMYGGGASRIIAPPFFADSRIDTLVQCADWLCALYGRVHTYHRYEDEYSDWAWSRDLYGDLLKKSSMSGRFKSNYIIHFQRLRYIDKQIRDLRLDFNDEEHF